MENKKNHIHLSESLRKKLENFPEDFPSENDWQEVRSRMLNEGLLRKKSARKKYLILLLLLLISGSAVLISIPFLSKKKNIVVENKNIPPQIDTKTAEKTGIKENETKEDEEKKKERSIINTDKKAIPEAKPKEETITAKTSEGKKTFSAINPPTGLSGESSTPQVEKNQPGPKATAEEQGRQVENKVALSSAGIAGEPEETLDAKTSTTETPVESVPETNTMTTGVADTSTLKNSSESSVAANDSASATQPNVAEKDSAAAAVTSEAKVEQENSSPRKIQLGFYISWDSNTYYLKESDNAEGAQADYILSSDSISGKKSGAQFTAGIRANYFISKKTAIEAGVFYSQKRKVDAVIYTPATSTSSAQSVSDYVYNYDAKYFEIDGRIKYYVYAKRPLVYISAGARGSFNLAKDGADYFEHTVYSESAVPYTERVLLEPASIGLSLVAAAGVELTLNSRCNFFLEPSYIYALDPVINNPDYIIVPVNHFRRSISIGTGLNYKF